VRGAIVFSAMLLALPVSAERRLLSSWEAEDPSKRMLAEVIARASPASRLALASATWCFVSLGFLLPKNRRIG
jgi:hypothetical protein